MIALGKKTIPASLAGANTPRPRGFVYEPTTAAVPASRLTLTEDGHAADPGQLLGLLVDADARNASSGLTFLAEHTAAADLTPPAAAKPAPITRVEIATATLSEGTGCVFKQYGALLRVAYDPATHTLAKVTELISAFVGPAAAALIEQQPTTVPTSYESAARVTAPGARGALVSAYLLTLAEHEWGGPNPPTHLTVYSQPNQDADMDLDQARQFRANVAAFLPRLDAMISVLAGLAANAANGGAR